MTEHIVRTWLRFLEVEQYWDSFIENGYDDMETVKLIEIQDLEAIGVTRSDHKKYLLENVRTLREQGAAWVYLVTGQHQLQTNTASDHDTDTSFSNYCDWSDLSQNSGSSSKDTDNEYTDPNAIITQASDEDQTHDEEDSRSIFRQIRQWICQRQEADFGISTNNVRPSSSPSSSSTPLQSVIVRHPTPSSYNSSSSFSTLQPRHHQHKHSKVVGQYTPVVHHKVYTNTTCHRSRNTGNNPFRVDSNQTRSYKVDTTVKYQQRQFWSDSATESNV